MPLNKLDNFIKNTEGRILYVSPADLDSTDSIDNTGNSLARPFKTIQRALLESARFSYVKGTSNDLTERTTILLMPGDHLVDNRPGFKIYKDANNITARVVEPGYTTTQTTPPGAPVKTAQEVLDLSLESSFDLTKEDNILYKFNSTEGGVIVPRGTSIVGLDLRKTKIKPLYVPNPTASYEDTPATAIFRITGACYFWQFSFFDGDENGLVYTDPSDFSDNNRSRPLFSHHKLTCFEYADGVNSVPIGSFDTELTDLDMYYAKLSNAYGTASGSPDRDIDDKYPVKPGGFAKQRPEWEIVGAFAADPITIDTISAGSGGVPSNTVTVTTTTNHNLTEGTPIKIRGVIPNDYNISAKVAAVDAEDPRKFTYQLPTYRTNLETGNSVNSSGGEVVIETDTVTGASPYIFNISLRSVYGMNGMQADGAKADGFRSMVVAQFTGVSLQKDDRAFVKYNKSGRKYAGIDYIKVTGSDLAAGSASTNTEQVYHLDSQAIYRRGWEQTHIKIKNDAILQIVSVFAIGYNKHFNCESGADASITNSNSNFGQLSLISDGFKKDAFAKDNKAFITNIFTPKSIETTDEEIDWLNIDVATTLIKANNERLYIAGFESEDNVPPVLTQGYRIGAKVEDELFVRVNNSETSARIVFNDGNLPLNSSNTKYSSFREILVQSVTDTKLDFGQSPKLSTGEKVLLISNTGEYPENIVPHQVYYVIAFDANTQPNNHRIALASTKTDAENGNAIKIYGGSDLKIVSRVTDKLPGEPGHPIQWDDSVNRWYIQTSNSTFYDALVAAGGASAFEAGETEPTFIRRRPDPRSLDEKVFKLRVVVPKELKNAKTPESGFIIQESSSTNVRDNGDFVPVDFIQNDATRQQKITSNDYDFNRNPRFISTCTFDSNTSIAKIVTEIPHNMRVGEKVVIRNVTDFANTSGAFNKGYNGTFSVVGINTNNMEFSVINNNVPAPGDNFSDKRSTNDVNTRTIDLPRYDRNDLTSNFYIYRNEIIEPYIEDQQDGVYHIYTLRSDIAITTEFTDLKYSQNVTDLYPQLDRDNVNDSPQSAKSYALRSPIGEVHTSDLKESITRDTANKFISKFTNDLIVENSSVVSTGITEIAFTRAHNFSGLISGSVGGSPSGYPINQTFYNVKLLDDDNAFTSNWRGATATISVDGSGGFTDSDVVITSRGSGYSSGETLYFDTTVMGDTGSLTRTFTPSSGDIINSTNDYIQVTGISTVSDQYYRIDSVPSAHSIRVHNPSTIKNIIPGQTVIHAGRSIAVTSYSVGTVTCSSPHGLVKGNRFRFLDSNDNSLGDFIVSAKTSPTQFEIDISKGEPSATPTYALKHFMSANDAVSDASQESIAGRGNTFYGGDSIELLEDLAVFMTTSGNENVPETKVKVTNIGQSSANSGNGDQTNILERFPIGSYIQIDDEIMRVARTDLINVNEMVVIRGALATEIGEHAAGSLIKKINPLPVEFRRPSIIRASGHTFEYLGYGPGNYSTGLPQVQDRTLTEREEFLTQAQERSAGIVVYTGMNNKGDFYIGNTKKSSATGEETSFDTPIPTITGEDAARLSAIFDEVTVKERIVVEGGDSGLILSQFDGPVTFNKEIRVKNNLNVSGILKIKNDTESTSTTTGSVQINGGVGIAKNVNIGGSMFFPDDKKLYFGNSNDLEIFHGLAGSGDPNGDSYIRDVGNGNLYIDSVSGTIFLRTDASLAKKSITCNDTDGVRLFYNDVTRLTTTGTGVTIGGELQVSGDITAFYTSDSRLKTNIKVIDDPLEKVLSLHGYTFDWNEESGKQGSETGVIAQEIEALGLPGLVTTRDNGYLAVNYEKLVPVLLGSIRELKFLLDKQNEKIKILTTRINDAETGIENIEEKLSDK